MASRTGMFLPEAARESLIKELKSKGELQDGVVPVPSSSEPKKSGGGGNATPATPTTPTEPWVDFGTGCLSCKEDNDHANLLLCEGCNDEYHTYCLDPPLQSVPSGDWFCDKCKKRGADPSDFVDDGLDELVCAMQPAYTSRFGEICWAQGGVGFGWWPAFIYDPRLTVGSARQLARKNLGKRHLVYFFECHDAPFAVAPSSKITKWELGIIEDYHLGKTAKAAGRVRSRLFQQALQAATIELSKPIELRLDWNHSIVPTQSLSPVSTTTIGQQQSQSQQQQTPVVAPSSSTTTTTNSSSQQQKQRQMQNNNNNNNTSSSSSTTPTNTATTSTTTKGKRGRPRKRGRPPNSTRSSSSSNNNNNNTSGSNEIDDDYVEDDEEFTMPVEPKKSRKTRTRQNRRGFDFLQPTSETSYHNNQQTTATATQIESLEDGELYCKLLKKVSPSSSEAHSSSSSSNNSSPSGSHHDNNDNNNNNNHHDNNNNTLSSTSIAAIKKWILVNVGFVKLQSRKTCTFADAREVIQTELVPDCIPANAEWKFFVPNLGPVSLKQEAKLGPMLSFLQSTSTGGNVSTTSNSSLPSNTVVDCHHLQDTPSSIMGDGSVQRPLEVLIVDSPLSSS